MLKEAAIGQLLVRAVSYDSVVIAWYWANMVTDKEYPVWPGEYTVADQVSTLNPVIDALPTNAAKIECIRDATLYDDNNPDPRVKKVLDSLADCCTK